MCSLGLLAGEVFFPAGCGVVSATVRDMKAIKPWQQIVNSSACAMFEHCGTSVAGCCASESRNTWCDLSPAVIAIWLIIWLCKCSNVCNFALNICKVSSVATWSASGVIQWGVLKAHTSFRKAPAQGKDPNWTIEQQVAVKGKSNQLPHREFLCRFFLLCYWTGSFSCFCFNISLDLSFCVRVSFFMVPQFCLGWKSRHATPAAEKRRKRAPKMFGPL